MPPKVVVCRYDGLSVAPEETSSVATVAQSAASHRRRALSPNHKCPAVRISPQANIFAGGGGPCRSAHRGSAMRRTRRTVYAPPASPRWRDHALRPESAQDRCRGAPAGFLHSLSRGAHGGVDIAERRVASPAATWHKGLRRSTRGRRPTTRHDLPWALCWWMMRYLPRRRLIGFRQLDGRPLPIRYCCCKNIFSFPGR